MDGVGLNPNPHGNAVYHAHTPVLDRLFGSVPTTQLVTWGPRVGLPNGQMGNSEVGHLNIGAGRVVEQELLRINRAIDERRLFEIPELRSALKSVQNTPGSALHFVGLMSSGGVHSSSKHLRALITAAVDAGVEKIFIHAITDGRDTAPRAAEGEFIELLEFLAAERKRAGRPMVLEVVSVIGRYYAMDRDNRGERTSLAYHLLVEGTGELHADALQAIRSAYRTNISDEFIKPVSIRTASEAGASLVKENDVLVFFNFRADRMRQIVSSFLFTGTNFNMFERRTFVRLGGVYTLTEYDPDFPVSVVFRPMSVPNHFGEVVSAKKLNQLRIAETEKYAHVTYFFNGGVEAALPGERRTLIPSPRDVPTYDLKPEMSAVEVTNELVKQLASGDFGVVIVNYANCDMVGHTGNFQAAVKAVETVDTCVGRVLESITKLGGVAIVTADHGNAEQMIDYTTGGPHTAHTLFPVPLSLVGEGLHGISLRGDGALCDIAPTACELLGLQTPAEMTGRSLIS